MVALAPPFARKELLVLESFVYVLASGRRAGQEVGVYELRVVVCELVVVDV